MTGATNEELREQKLNIAEVAKILTVSEMTVRRLIDSGQLRAYRITERAIRVPISAVREYLAEAAQRGAS